MDTNPAFTHSFLFLGNHPAIDFVNTVIRRNGQLVDLLPEPGDLALWTAKAGLGATHPEPTGQDLCEARDLRQALRQLLLSWRQEEVPDAGSLERVNRVLRWRRQAPTLGVRDGKIGWRDEEPGKSPRDVLLHLAEQAAQLRAAMAAAGS